MTSSPRERLAGALSMIADTASLAVAAGVGARQMANALEGRPINASAFLRLCAQIGHDPLPQLAHARPAPPWKASNFNFTLLASGFKIRRGLNGHNDRTAAKAIAIAPSTICRIERGDMMSVGVVLRACEYIGIHPFGYCDAAAIAPVSRETPMKSVA